MSVPNSPPSPLPKAAALRYDPAKPNAPTLTAKGRGAMAERIIEVAQAHGIPLHRDADLLEILEQIELNTEIPLEIYAVVAEIFAYLYRTNQAKAEKSG
jgi:flagellar biosynthesis protein